MADAPPSVPHVTVGIEDLGSVLAALRLCPPSPPLESIDGPRQRLQAAFQAALYVQGSSPGTDPRATTTPR